MDVNKLYKTVDEKIIVGNGRYDSRKNKWEINTSSILTRLIQEAGRKCESYASDLFIDWIEINNKLENGTMKTSDYYFGFRRNGVDHKGFVESDGRKKHDYILIMKLEIRVNYDEIEMELYEVI